MQFSNQEKKNMVSKDATTISPFSPAPHWIVFGLKFIEFFKFTK